MTRIASRTRGRDDEPEDRPSASAGYRGRAALERYADEERKAKERRDMPRMPFRFRAEYGPDAKPTPLIFLDKSIDNAYFMYEHSVQDDQGRWGHTEICIKEHDVGCPLCQLEGGKNSKVGRSTYVMLLTVLDLRPYKNKDGKKIPYTKRLFAIKGSQIGDWMKIFERAEKKYGGLRGLYVEVSRNDKQDAATGKPELLDNDMVFDHIKEQELLDEYGHDAVLGDNKKVIKKADEDVTAFDYDAIFKLPSFDDLARRYGVKSRSPGSREDTADEEWERPSRRRASEQSEEETPSRGRTARRVTQEDIPEAEEQEEDDAPPPPRRTRQEREAEPEEEAPRRSRSRASSEAPVSRSRRVAEPEEEVEEPEEEAPRRTRSRSAPAEAKAAPATRSRRQPAPEPEEVEEAEEQEQEEDDTPRRVSARSRSREADKPVARGRTRAAAHEEEDEAF